MEDKDIKKLFPIKSIITQEIIDSNLSIGERLIIVGNIYQNPELLNKQL